MLGCIEIFNKKEVVLTECTHITGTGDLKAIKKDILKKEYGDISFSFDFLEQAQHYFKGIFGSQYDGSNIRTLIPRTKNAPLLFVYNHPLAYSKKQKQRFFAIAPRVEPEEKTDDE
jgi:hypothetical protein